MNVIDAIRQALREHKLLRIQYRKLNSDLSDRILEPYEIKAGRLWAWDTAKDDHIRQFIITGILSAVVLEEVFDPRDFQ